MKGLDERDYELIDRARETIRLNYDAACGNRPAGKPAKGAEKEKKKSFMDKLKETFED